MRLLWRHTRRLWLLAAVMASACGTSAPAAAPTPHVGAHPGEQAPPLSGTSLQGHQLSLASLRGKVVVVLFWASWCTPCQAEQPAVDALAAGLDPGAVRFLGVSVDVDRSAARSYVSRFAVPYDSLVDTTQSIVVDFDVAGPPTTFVIDRTGHVSAELVGELTISDLRADIETALTGH